MARLTRTLEAQMDAGRVAAQSGLGKLLAVHESKVLNRMVSEYRSVKGLSPESALLGIGIIAELRSLAGSVDRAVERGADAGRQITS